MYFLLVGLRNPIGELFTGPWRNLENNCTVVFAFFVTEPACVWACEALPLASSVTFHAKTTVNCSPGSSMHKTMFLLPSSESYYQKEIRFGKYNLFHLLLISIYQLSYFIYEVFLLVGGLNN